MCGGRVSGDGGRESVQVHVERVTDRERGHQVLRIVKAGEFCRALIEKFSSLKANGCAVQREICVRVTGTECDGACRERGEVGGRIDDGNVRGCLIFKNPEFRRAIRFHVGIPVEVVGAEIQPDRNLRMECPDRLELEGAHFKNHHIQLVAGAHCRRERQADISARHRAHPAGFQHVGGQFCCRRLSVGSGDGDGRARAFFGGKLKLSQNGNIFCGDVPHQRDRRIDARAENSEVVDRGVGVRLGPEQDANSAGFEGGGLGVKFLPAPAVAHRHVRALLQQKQGRGLAAVAESQDNRFFSAVNHLSKFECGKAEQGEENGHDPEPHDHGVFLPAAEFEMVVQG